jgi:hypothetical protein
MQGSSGKREHTPSDASMMARHATSSHNARVQITLPSLQPHELQLSPEGTALPSGKTCPAASHD